ncbi:para-aminobenzoate synthetase [Spinactinospora alkalitolerans]|uniref:aminodeoxychorismate synthase n=1 Tax=Spinactinospora alkalitolerans TaxID=687207 RepID=A0A852TX74_9ACTN|nr:aminodeoxychorismate synthase component I [Spinactinospora alkalitolerans]NYE47433.1 para-aminobenzoate synthetase [Spinactinospora alkalitolerans]
MRVLLVDNHDSYTYNLFQLIAEVVGVEPTVLTNDDPRWDTVDPAGFDGVVISPGPGRPQHARDVGRVPRLLDRPDLAVLGVCLGHQAIAHAVGAPVVSAPVPRHGHLSRVHHTGEELFAGVPQDFTAVRYHSLRVCEPLPPELAATAWAEDGVVMALRHRALPRWGVQFHPESIASEHGRALIANFRALAARARGARTVHSAPARVTETREEDADAEPSEIGRTGRVSRSAHSELGEHRTSVSETPARGGRPHPGPLRYRTLPGAVDAEAAFVRLYGESEHAFWLDSSLAADPARFSFLGDADGPGGEVLTYRVGEGAVTVRASSGARHREPGSIFDVLRRRVAHRPRALADLPFDFTGGYVGYFGYELKADCGAAAAHRAPTPDAVWLRCDRFLAVDHVEDRTYLVALGPGAEEWLAATADTLSGLAPAGARPGPTPGPTADPEPHLERPREGYLTDVKECLGHLAAGESYEICLTNRLRLPAPADDLVFYRRLRRMSPAPYAALLRLGETTVHSASPERFLRVDAEGVLESRPIKGTAPRRADPAEDARLAEELRTNAKTRAENLMIVDLLRNDLGRVCEVGSVEVPAFMYTESYATVHQLVSTVRGRLRPDVSPVEAVRACFPGGSMTGAPKPRTMEIIDGLESSARGVYSGALGYISHGGTADLSIVIRTAVRTGDDLTIGAGGAIVLDSDPRDEYDEMLLKASVPLRGLPPSAPEPDVPVPGERD